MAAVAPLTILLVMEEQQFARLPTKVTGNGKGQDFGSIVVHGFLLANMLLKMRRTLNL